MATRTPGLEQTDLFGTLPPELLAQLRGRTALARYRRGDTIFEKGEPATHLYVAVTYADGDGTDVVRGRHRHQVSAGVVHSFRRAGSSGRKHEGPAVRPARGRPNRWFTRPRPVETTGRP